ncbi:MAG: histidine kinase [Marinilabiliales bacterium]|nr:MAG: histidine kinase [Marinilabiliales bacterium]
MKLPDVHKISIETISKDLTAPSFYWLALENFFVIILAFSIKILKQWYVSRKEKELLEKKNLESELKLLKMQINPHFLFNTLNNINSLVFLDQQKTYDSIIKLSEMLRYLTYETKSDKVLLGDELKMISNYIELQRIRFKNKDFIHFSISKEINSGYMVAPMLFIPFVENTFKYCRKNIDREPGIKISFRVSGNCLIFQSTNYFNPDKEQNEGIGIDNVRKRLHLLYPGRYTLVFRPCGHIFSVLLTLQITKHADH